MSANSSIGWPEMLLCPFLHFMPRTCSQKYLELEVEFYTRRQATCVLLNIWVQKFAFLPLDIMAARHCQLLNFQMLLEPVILVSDHPWLVYLRRRLPNGLCSKRSAAWVTSRDTPSNRMVPLKFWPQVKQLVKASFLNRLSLFSLGLAFI